MAARDKFITVRVHEEEREHIRLHLTGDEQRQALMRAAKRKEKKAGE